jgi:hypothetical protein
MPGARVASWYGLPSMSGSSLICLCVTVVPVLTEPVSSTGAEAMVVTVSPTPVTDTGTSSVSLSATRISMFSRVALEKPCAVTVSVYRPGLRSGKV